MSLLRDLWRDPWYHDALVAIGIWLFIAAVFGAFVLVSS